jgi:hypothetical protein
MTELDLIRSFRADMPPPTLAATEQARRAWSASKPPRPRWIGRAVIAACLVAVAMVGALVLPGVRDGGLGPPDARAAKALRLAAAAPQGEPLRPLRPGEFWYVKRRAVTAMSAGDDYSLVQPQISETWVGIDGTGRSRVTPKGRPRFPTPLDRKRWEANGRLSGGLGGVSDDRFSAGGKAPFYLGNEALTYRELLALPRGPSDLYRRVRRAAVECECGNSVEQETFVIVADLLRGAPLPPASRAALLRAAALIPGIKLLDAERDIAGRKGVGVALDAGGRRVVLIFERDTYRLLGEKEELLEDTDFGQAGWLVGGGADVKSAIVDSLDARP